MRIGIIGATGKAGRLIARRLASDKAGDLRLIGRDQAKLETLRSEISFGNTEVQLVDLMNRDSISDSFKGLDLMIVALPTADYLTSIVDAAIDNHVDCFDILLPSNTKKRLLASREGAIKSAGICYITDAGYHAGLPSAMIRWAETLCRELTAVEVYSSFGLQLKGKRDDDIEASGVMREFADIDISVLRDSKWVSGYENIISFDFGRGEQSCLAMGMEELKLLNAEIPSLENAGFLMSGFGGLVDGFITPISLWILENFPKRGESALKLFMWGVRKFSHPHDVKEMILRGRSDRGNVELTVSHRDAYEIAAVSVAACLRQYNKRAGLWRQGLFVEPIKFFKDLQSMGIRTTTNVRS